ncbi:MAG: 30S ribosomal protein S7 [Candidatus Adlerbacteria bacterium GW2011_GWB1_54_7]|uniref:30S ribosomal protein S7 n=1 Tax=Candidatus Adlerbacteria bacterium GW2011_GWB1_54_7 TaxID=1618607 RepID=A0A0G1Y2F0_9BACT|nr:MAG: 30S ribosomal protein S7 [Candidatus Adlerbacteria bacterium GW2011_GWB1_54_7]
MRRPVKNRNIVGSDLRYNSTKVEKFINSLMWSGKKSTARKVVYDAFDIVKEKTKTEDPLEIFETALRNVGPQMGAASAAPTTKCPARCAPSASRRLRSGGYSRSRAAARGGPWRKNWPRR